MREYLIVFMLDGNKNQVTIYAQNEIEAERFFDEGYMSDEVLAIEEQ